MKKSSNNQKIINRQGNINITAGGNVYNWPYQQNVDNSEWYSIPKEQTLLLEKVSKFIIENLWKAWGIISGIASLIIWGITGIWSFLNFISTYKPNTAFQMTRPDFWSLLDALFKWWFGWHFLSSIVAIIFLILGVTILNSMKYRDQRQCPQCKKHYGLVEVGESKEKEILTSKGYRVTQIRHYKCNGCWFKKKEEYDFIRNINQD